MPLPVPDLRGLRSVDRQALTRELRQAGVAAVEIGEVLALAAAQEPWIEVV